MAFGDWKKIQLTINAILLNKSCTREEYCRELLDVHSRLEKMLKKGQVQSFKIKHLQRNLG